MKTLENIFKGFQYFCLITVITLFSFIIVVQLFISCGIANDETRNYSYEAYCDSIWESDPDYYLDVLCTTDEYQEYVEVNGKWWE